MATTGNFRTQLQHGGFAAGLRGAEHFPDPFLDMASLAMPQTWRNALEWCEYAFMANGTYRMAMERIISYFITEITVEEVGDDEKEKWLSFLNQELGLLTGIKTSLRNRMCYGNDFISVLVPFKRMLACKGQSCGALFPLHVVYNNSTFRFKFQDYEFVASCPRCGYRGVWKIVDEPDDEERKLTIKHWSPHEIEILHDPYTDQVAYLWRIPEDYKRLVRQGHLYHLERVSERVLQAIKNNQMFRFHDDVIFHMKEPGLSGTKNRGWGISRVLTNFRQIWYVQVLKRYNEAIALDYVIPFRLITPVPRGSGGSAPDSQDMLMTMNAGDFMGQVRGMLRKRRRDPASWQTLPFPVQYQALGGDATQLAPRDLIDQAQETLLNDAGTPVQLYRGDMQLQTAPVALRLFEATWQHMVHDLNDLLRWVVTQVSRILSWEEPEVKMKSVTYTDDIDKQMAALQLFAGQQISGTSALDALGYRWKEEQKRMAEEARYQAEQQSDLQEEMEQAGFAQQVAQGMPAQPGAPGQAPAAGGQAPAGQGQTGAEGEAMAPPTPVTNYLQSMGPNTPVSPQDIEAAADQLAQELLGMPEGVKDSELRKLKQSNPTLHARVKEKMDEIRSDARMAGGAAVMQQQFGAGAGGGM